MPEPIIKQCFDAISSLLDRTHDKTMCLLTLVESFGCEYNAKTNDGQGSLFNGLAGILDDMAIQLDNATEALSTLKNKVKEESSEEKAVIETPETQA